MAEPDHDQNHVDLAQMGNHVDTALENPMATQDEWRAGNRLQAGRAYLQHAPYDAKIAAVIVARVAEGQHLTEILDEYGLSWGSIRKWAKRHDDFADALSEADKLGSRVMAERAVIESGKPVGSMAEAAARKLHVDTLKWKAGKDDPEKYGDKVQADITFDLGKTLDKVLRKGQPITSPVIDVPRDTP